MKCKDLFLESLQTLLHSWGGDAPSEAVWAFNDIVEWLNEEYNLNIQKLKEDLSNESEIFEKLEYTEFISL